MSAPLPSRLLGVWAHPDDECYLSAGLMARVVDAGGEVRVLCATRGELGTADPDLAGSAAFASSRQRELEASLAVLGVADLHLMGLGDGRCHLADPATMVDAIRTHVADFSPDVVVTFGPDGITGHSDHIAVSSWASAAVAGGVDLHYATMSRSHVARHRELHDSIGLFADLPGGPVSVGSEDVSFECALGDDELVRKRRALACHGSQTDGLAALMGEDLYRTWWRHETFRRPTPGERERADRTIGLVR